MRERSEERIEAEPAGNKSELAVQVNGGPRRVAGGSVVGDLVREMGFERRKGIAVAVNGEVVPRTEWAAREFAPGDVVLVIQATQGG